MKIIIRKKNIGERLDKILVEKLKDFSRAQIQNLIKQGKIKVDGRVCAPHYKLKEGEAVEFDKKFEPEISGDVQAVETKKKGEDFFSEIKIVADTDDYLVINKPAGLIVHGGTAIKEKTLVDWLLIKYPQIKKVGEDLLRPGIVHRLDKEVSGLMVIAKNQKTFDCLKKQFQKRTARKEYTALVYDSPKRDSGELNFPIRRSASGFRMAAIPGKYHETDNLSLPGARHAVTEFFVIKRFHNFSLLRVKIKTGRTHQIRVHLFAFGHPLVGDNLYSTARTRMQNKKLETTRVSLVADKLSFEDPDGKRVEFQIDLPEDFLEMLKRVK